MTHDMWIGDVGQLDTFGEGPLGELYIVNHSGTVFALAQA